MAIADVFERIAGGTDVVVDSLALGTGNDGAGEPTAAIGWGFVAALVGLAVLLAATGFLDAAGTRTAWARRVEHRDQLHAVWPTFPYPPAPRCP